MKSPHEELNTLHEGVLAEVYHAAPGVSNSKLKLFARSPKHYRHALAHPSPTTGPQRKGQIFHTCVLENHLYGDGKSHYLMPVGPQYYASNGAFGTTSASKDWKKDHCDLPIISEEERQNFEGARAAILAEPMGELLLGLPAKCEVSTWVKHEATGLLLKSRFDRLAEDSDGQPWIIDIKSTDDARRFKYTARDFRYDVQSVFYRDNLTRSGTPNARFVFIVVELEPPYGVRFAECNDETSRFAREIYEAELVQLAQCEKTGEWPGYSPAGIELIEVWRKAQ